MLAWLFVLRRSFFVKGRQFRQPAYLATSFSEAVARQFLAMRGGSDCVLWRVRSVPSSFCFLLPHSAKPERLSKLEAALTALIRALLPSCFSPTTKATKA